MIGKGTSILRAFVIALAYATTLGLCYGVRLFWPVQTAQHETYMSRLYIATEATLCTSPFIFLSSMMFAFVAVPLAAWSVGSSPWRSVRRYVYAFWLALALYIVVWGNADGLILCSGVGLITLWIIRNYENPILGYDLRGQTPVWMARSKFHITVFLIMVSITCALSLYLTSGDATKSYVVEIIAVYTIACLCEAAKAFPTIWRRQKLSP